VRAAAGRLREQPVDLVVEPVDTHHADKPELQLEPKLELKFQSEQKPEHEPESESE
jgi:hypothetical protein